MSARVVMEGLDELITEMTKAPEEIRREGMEILQEETTGAAVEIGSALGVHRKTGKLLRSLRVTFPSSTILQGIVQLVAPHAHLQFGTKARETDQGASRGRMPDIDVVVPIAQRRRERMYRRMREMLERRGFQVSA